MSGDIGAKQAKTEKMGYLAKDESKVPFLDIFIFLLYKFETEWSLY